MSIKEVIAVLFGKTTIVDERDAEAYVSVEDHGTYRLISHKKCSKCGYRYAYVYGVYNRCPYCGRRIVE